eukprot:Sspe_Gene.39867::Locus_19217_Transcript_3_5_Confidence_0.462_Length_647::g.39867::m.39867/K12840/RBM17, SPF45; splicing factor 45
MKGGVLRVVRTARRGGCRGGKPRQDRTPRGVPHTPCLLIRNMVRSGELHDLKYDEVVSVLSAFGGIVSVTALEEVSYPSEEAVRIFVRYDTSAAARAAQEGLHLRAVKGRVVAVDPFPLERFVERDFEPRADEHPLPWSADDAVV